MTDVIVLILTAAFFAIAVAYVGLCDRIIGPDPEPPIDQAELNGADAPMVDATPVAARA